MLCDNQQTVPNCVATCSCLRPAGLCNAIPSPSSSTNHFMLTAAAEQQHCHTAAVCDAAHAAASSLCEECHQGPAGETTQCCSQPCSTCRQHGTSSHSATARPCSKGECHAHTAAGEKAYSASLPAWPVRQVDLRCHAYVVLDRLCIMHALSLSDFRGCNKVLCKLPKARLILHQATSAVGQHHIKSVHDMTLMNLS